MRRRRLIVCFLAIIAALVLPAFANASGPENAIVVINAQSDSSKLIGNYYVRRRKIPAQNVVYLYNLPNLSSTNLTICRNKILKPIVEHIQTRKLNQQIDYIIYSTDIPTQINMHREAKDYVAAKRSVGIDLNERFFNGSASISSVTYFLLHVLQERNDFIALNANKYCRRRNISITQKVFNGLEQEKFEDAIRKVQLNKFEEADALLKELMARHTGQPALYYWAAKNAAMAGDTKACIEQLKRSVQYGFQWREFLATDRILKPLLKEDEFRHFIDSVEANNVAFLPTHHFDSNYIWGPNGFPNGQAEQGDSYVLSTVLGVTYSKGNSEREVLNYLESATAADATRPSGTFYFCDTRDVRNRTRRRNYDFAITELQRLGFEAEIYSGVLPENVHDIAGLMFGKSHFQFAETKSSILPGAICENLTSYGAVFKPSVGQTKLSELIRYGAAGSSGTVREPYALQSKFPHPMMHVHYARGCTLAEAFYQSVAGPFQLLIAGDALCQPYAVPPKFQILNRKEFERDQSGEISLELERLTDSPDILRYELYVDGALEQQSQSNQISFDSRQLNDGYHELRVVAVANNVGRNRSRAILPVVVNNYGKRCQAKIQSPRVDWHGVVTVQVESNCGSSATLQHNGRILTGLKLVNGKASLRIDARRIGRGESDLSVVVKCEDGNVTSNPVALLVDGPVSNNVSYTSERGVLHYENADHLALVRHHRGRWQLISNRDDGPIWYDFEPQPRDRLLAALDLTNDNAKLIEGTSKYQGMEMGVKRSDLRITPNRFLRRKNESEFEVKGNFFIDHNNQRVSIGEVRGGIAAAENSSGNAFLMYSEENIRLRFRNLKPIKNTTSK